MESVDPLLFEQTNIVDLDFRSSGIQVGKRSFMNLEVTLFIKEHMDFKSSYLETGKTKYVSHYNDRIDEFRVFYLTQNKNVKV